MVAIAFHFRESPDPLNYIEKWRINAEALYAKLIVIDTSRFKIAEHYSHKKVKIYRSLEEVEEDYTEIVYLESPYFLERANIPYIWLHNFEHPESAVYVVGDNYTAIQTKGRENKTWVSIKCPKNTILYADTAAMITLYDRIVKKWQLQ